MKILLNSSWEQQSAQAFDLKNATVGPDSFNFKDRLHYLSLHFLDSPEFGAARILRELSEAWLDGKVDFPGAKFEKDPQTLSDQEPEQIPGAKVATGAVDALKLEVLVRDGAKVVIKPDEARFWQVQSDGIASDFEALEKNHRTNFMECA